MAFFNGLLVEETSMHLRFAQSALSAGMILGCLACPCFAQQTKPSAAPNSLWTTLGRPALERMGLSTKPKPKSREMKVEIPAQPDSSESVVAPAVFTPSEHKTQIDTTSFESPFSAVKSSRRRAIVERAAEKTVEVSAPIDEESLSARAPIVTPHWSLSRANEAAYLQAPDFEAARPVAVTMRGELFAERLSVVQAVATMDATLKIAPTAARESKAVEPTTETRDSRQSTVKSERTASQLATATAAER
jgi:hypothetical protein